MNRFVLDWLAGDERFLRRRRLERSDDTPRDERSEALATALDESNRRWGISAPDAIERWQRGEGVTIVAGQQVGFAGGPLYTLAKLATLLRLKRDLERRGTPVSAFFWLATEDHDFDEVATLNVPVSLLAKEKDVNRQRDLVCMRAVRTSGAKAVVGSLPIPESLTTQLLSLFDIPRPSWLREGIAFRDSFAELVASIAGNEIVLVDALLPELRRAGASLFDRIRSSHDEIERALAARTAELERAGYAEQVVPREDAGYTLLFAIDGNGERRPSMAPQSPERTSTSALTRPLLQDSVLMPDVFVGGPAEVAYYAQIAPIHELLGVAMPRVALRGHVLVVPEGRARTFERYGIPPGDAFDSPEAILAAHEPEGVARIRSLADEAKRDLFARIEQIGELALPADHSLAGSIQRSVGHLEYHFDKLAERAVKALVRRDRERFDATRRLVSTLMPDRHVQDRVVSWFAFWQSYGSRLLDRMVEEVEPDSDHFKIAGI